MLTPAFVYRSATVRIPSRSTSWPSSSESSSASEAFSGSESIADVDLDPLIVASIETAHRHLEPIGGQSHPRQCLHGSDREYWRSPSQTEHASEASIEGLAGAGCRVRPTELLGCVQTITVPVEVASLAFVRSSPWTSTLLPSTAVRRLDHAAKRFSWTSGIPSRSVSVDGGSFCITGLRAGNLLQGWKLRGQERASTRRRLPRGWRSDVASLPTPLRTHSRVD